MYPDEEQAKVWNTLISMGGSGQAEAASGASYVLASWLFIRLLGVIYFVAFISLASQIRGLVGQHGILRARQFLDSRRHWGWHRFYRIPTLCWLRSDDKFLLSLSWGGAVISLLLVAGIASMPALIALWVSYLSLFSIGRIFLGYQWDILLLETGFLAIFLAPLQLLPDWPPTAAPPTLIRSLLWWLLFRLMFSSGMVKLRSGDATWRKLTALRYHYETQPLPTPPAWQAHQLPLWFHKFAAVLTLTVELLAPFLILGPPPLRHVAGALFVMLMLLIQLTGNYGFFNLLGIALSILLLDDQFLERTVPLFAQRLHPLPSSPVLSWLAVPISVVILLLSVPTVLRLFRVELSWPRPTQIFFQWLEPFRLVNGYGLFSVMTTERPEIIVEGSHDGVTWQPYEFKWKPGDVRRAPPFVAPHQPRLDWQMWFAALGYYPNNPWMQLFLTRLLEGSPAVLRLLKSNPFSKAPPRFVRCLLYDYRFTTRSDRRLSGAWWRREQRPTFHSSSMVAN